MNIQQNISLQPYNTFSVPATAQHFVTVTSVSELHTLLSDPTWQTEQKLILGEGSNVLLTQDFPGLVIHNQIKGIEVFGEDAEHIWLNVGAGENWHNFVMYCVNQGYAGIENLSLIPGTVGAAPIQNIGAYGVELKDTLSMVEVMSIDGSKRYTMQCADCRLGYRDSVFKHALKDKVVITHVTFRLNKNPTFHTEYGAIEQMLKNNNVETLSIKAVSDAVIQIRQSKLPDPKKIGNAGSFFKNPIIDAETLSALQTQHSDIPFYPMTANNVKLPAAWLIEQTGFKGKQVGHTGTHHTQPLVLVNHGKALGSDILALSEQIRQSVLDKFGIMLNTEVNII